MMHRSGRDVWAPELLAKRPDLTMQQVDTFLHDLYRVQPDFVYSVSREFARTCQTPLLVMPDDVPAHPYATSLDITELAPKAEVTIYPWKDTPDLKEKALSHVRTFLRAHEPVAAR